jgi:hypothetical protein
VVNPFRPAAAGAESEAAVFMRGAATPSPAVVWQRSTMPDPGWPGVGASAGDPASAAIGHGAGWTCEVRASHLLLINPLGEGALRAPLPALPIEWITDVRASSSAVHYVVDGSVLADAPDLALSFVDPAEIWAATVRTSFGDDFGKAEPVGRNAPCPCGSGLKFKRCHGR